MMKILKIIALLVVSVTSSFGEVKKIKDPERVDNGVHEWTVGATGGAGEVVVLRWTLTRTVGNTKHTKVHHTVSYDPGKKIEDSFKATYDEVKGHWKIEPFGGFGWLEAEYSNSSTENNLGSIKFTNKEGQTYVYAFSVSVMSYQEAVGIYDGLPDDMTTGWKWSGEPKMNKPKGVDDSVREEEVEM